MAGWQRELDYLLAAGPLLAAILAVPTLEEAAQGELLFPRPVVIEPRELIRHHHSLAVSERALREGRWWTLFSYTLLHEDSKHLLGNVQSLILYGLGVFLDAGAFGLYGTFLACGAAAAANSKGRTMQMQAQLEFHIPRVPERIVGLSVPEEVRGWWDSVRTGTAKLVAPAVGNVREAVGASAAISGLMGYSLASAILGLARHLLLPLLLQRGGGEQVAGRRLVDGGDGTASSSGRRPSAPPFDFGGGGAPAGVEAVASLINCIQCGRFLAGEWWSASGKEGLTRTDHAGHLTGFATGFGLALATAGMRWLTTWRPGGGPPDLDDQGRRRPTGRRYVNAFGEVVGR